MDDLRRHSTAAERKLPFRKHVSVLDGKKLGTNSS